MSVSSNFVLHGIATPSSFISQISSASMNTQINTALGTPAGVPFPTFVYNLNQNPDYTFTCEQIKTLLDLTGVGLGDISSGNTDMLFKSATNKGSRVANATTSHWRARAPEAVLVPLSISASNDSPASMQARIVCMYDGTNAPITNTGTIALSGTSTATEHFVVGPVSINGSTIPGVLDWNLSFGLDLIETRSDGELYISFLAIREARPILTVRCLGSAAVTYGLNGTALTAMTCCLRKCAATGRVANATAEHIAFTATAGLITVPEVSGGNNSESITTIRCELIGADASTAPLAVNTAVAIS